MRTALIATLLSLAAAPPPAPSRLRDALAAIAAESDGRVAVTVRHLRTGEGASLRGDRPQPPMSVFKLPLAVAAFADIEAGRLRLAQRVPIVEAELRDVSPIADAWRAGDRAPTLESMLARMLEDSDNTAGDKLVTMLGGGAAVTARLRKLGITGITVAGQELARDAALLCVGRPEPPGGWTLAAVRACPPPDARAQAAVLRRELDTPADSETTDAVVDLLARLDHGAVLSAPSRAWLLSAMAATTTGKARLRAGLPEGTHVEHRTGTSQEIQGIRLAVNDAGIVRLPGGDRFAVAVFISGSRAPLPAQEAIIARLARAAWDAFAAPVTAPGESGARRR
jgi:beta-lactamase class A